METVTRKTVGLIALHKIVYNSYMPTILVLFGWRLFFYSNEGNEPIHIHCQKAAKECKFWIYPNEYDVKLAYEYHVGSKDKRLLRKIIFANFEYIIEQWNAVHGG